MLPSVPLGFSVDVPPVAMVTLEFPASWHCYLLNKKLNTVIVVIIHFLFINKKVSF